MPAPVWTSWATAGLPELKVTVSPAVKGRRTVSCAPGELPLLQLLPVVQSPPLALDH